GAQFLHRPRSVFQQSLRHTHEVQRGHLANSDCSSRVASVNASSCAFSQEAERTRSLRSAAFPNNPPNRLLAVSIAPETAPSIEGLNRVRNPLLQRSQKNSN